MLCCCRDLRNAVSIGIMSQDHKDREIQITVKVFGGLRESFQGGTQLHQLPSQATLGVLLHKLGTDSPELSTKLIEGINAGYLNTLINGRNVQFLQGQETKLEDGDTVAFLPPVGGG